MRKEIGPIATPDVIQWAPGLPKTRSGKIMRRILRKIAENDFGNLGDTSTLADPARGRRPGEEPRAVTQGVRCNPTIRQLAADLAAGRTTSRKLTEEALARIEDPKGEGARAFIKVYKTQALAAADASDALRKAGIVASAARRPPGLDQEPVQRRGRDDAGRLQGARRRARRPSGRARGARACAPPAR